MTQCSHCNVYNVFNGEQYKRNKTKQLIEDTKTLRKALLNKILEDAMSDEPSKTFVIKNVPDSLTKMVERVKLEKEGMQVKAL